ncbi:hypothetical protein [Portibacter marinus]|uniref:hypothetical protein n=1 Tax=Portibacter marinus TaxID=2898660 RepID=UPI001F3A27F6|nr:hypothetical protein [Portibacter marinus]
MKKKDTEQLKSTIQSELGIDILKYQNEEVAENLMDLLLFPKYILKWIGRPILICLLLYFVGFFVIDLVHVEYIIYAIAGCILFLILGFLTGVIFLTRKLGQDLSSISEYSLGLMKNSVLDIDDMGSRVNKSNIKDVLGMLFKGIVFVVTIPMLKKAIDKKVPVGKGLLKLILGGSLAIMAKRISFNPDKVDENMVKVDGKSKFITRYVTAIDKTKTGSSTLIKKALRLASTPFRLGAYLFGFILLVFLYFIW